MLDVENLRLHYAQTLRDWLTLYEAPATGCARCSMGASCACGACIWPAPWPAFTTGTLQLFQVVFAPAAEQRRPPDARAPVHALTDSAHALL